MLQFLSFQDIVAVGGRYDHLVAEFAEKFSLADDVAAGGGSSQCAAVGVSISLDRLAAAVSQDEVATKFASADILICSQVKTLCQLSHSCLRIFVYYEIIIY